MCAIKIDFIQIHKALSLSHPRFRGEKYHSRNSGDYKECALTLTIIAGFFGTFVPIEKEK